MMKLIGIVRACKLVFENCSGKTGEVVDTLRRKVVVELRLVFVLVVASVGDTEMKVWERVVGGLCIVEVVCSAKCQHLKFG
ncbi:hypothetical protein V6N12_069029 [Hibiscus sabdariffa]|uniref:Uncharacterized protein n=1 Tax=Hibiscus sabdariffa TaxID=183260 RepID=A0ABR2FCT3_9ROSI